VTGATTSAEERKRQYVASEEAARKHLLENSAELTGRRSERSFRSGFGHIATARKSGAVLGEREVKKISVPLLVTQTYEVSFSRKPFPSSHPCSEEM
jgi:hypothetical protein